VDEKVRKFSKKTKDKQKIKKEEGAGRKERCGHTWTLIQTPRILKYNNVNIAHRRHIPGAC
jgi:hypothetical protein